MALSAVAGRWFALRSFGPSVSHSPRLSYAIHFERAPGWSLVPGARAIMSVEIIRDPLWNNIRLDPLSFE
ncbi:MAG: hypothetical protein ACREBE_08105, partial [bacterium]